jgi:4-hydroxythreonine-4-phosphate dehydrogenase
MPNLPPIALTPGEPAGIAPEIAAQAWMALAGQIDFCFFLIGDAVQYQARAQAAGFAVEAAVIAEPGAAHDAFARGLPVLDRKLTRPSHAGQLDPANAPAVIAAIDEAVALALMAQASAIVTCPIQKETLYGAGFKFQGHTDYLGSLARNHGHAAHDVMMLVAGDLKAVPLTVHIPLADVPEAITQQEIITQTKIIVRDLTRYFGVKNPRIAVTGLNPHAGENGAMGLEEKQTIIPALDALRAEGLNVAGPLPADTAFHVEARRGYDAILCMYHDQALIPAKTIDFHGGVNVTLGLPFIRTSPDHGTALGIAGKGVANPTSLITALKLAHQMARVSA